MVPKMPESPITKLTKAVLELDTTLAKIQDEGQSKAGELIQRGDGRARELESDIKLVLQEIKDELDNFVRSEAERLKIKYAAEKEERLRITKASAQQYMDRAVQTILEELRKLLGEV
jgi:vacuolar-type H+-ATPase subunit E/Vma4